MHSLTSLTPLEKLGSLSEGQTVTPQDARVENMRKAREQKVENSVLRAEGLPKARPQTPNAYVNTLLAESDVAQEMRTRDDRFYNSRDPAFTIQEEKSQHVLCILLKVQGKNGKEIAALLNKSEVWVSNVLRQPWAKKRMLDEIRAAGGDAIKAIFQNEAVASIERIVEIRDDPSAPKAVSLAASNSILDRFLGKPTQHVETKNESTISYDKIEDMQKRLERLRAEEAALNVTRKN